MRIVKVGVLAPTNKGIPLGVQGENRATEVEFDTRPWFREYPSGTVSAVARRNGDPAPYPLTLDVADGTAVWQVSDTDTAKAGEGAVELTMTSGGARVRSLTFKMLVTASLTDAPVDDDAWYGWLDKAVVKVDETVQSAQRKMAEVNAEWTDLKADVTEKVDECGEVAKQAASDAHHAKVDAQATAKALESAEGSVAKAEAAATRAEDAAEQAYGAAGQASVSAGNASDAASDAREASAQAAGWADMADKSARNAYTSESNAALSASSAADSAEHATAQKVAAENAKDAAESFKAGAEAAKGEAAASASNAASSATAAANSASDAAASVGAINVIAPKTVDVAASSEVDGSVAVGAGSVAKNANEFSIGNDTLTREITHVSTPSADSSASTKKYTDDNDANALAEAKQYTDANTSNALVGTVSGTLLHVEDAWPGKPLGLTIDGAYKQDGTPSPDNPVPIEVIENPVVKVTGRNLLNTEQLSNEKNFDKSQQASGFWVYKFVAPSTGDYTVSVQKTSNYANTDYLMVSDNPKYGVGKQTWFSHQSAVSGTTRATFKNVNAVYLYFSTGIYYVQNVLEKVGGIQIEKGSTATALEPYTSQSLPFTLPTEHPYLAALPDGTHDEIVVRDGRRVLVNRVLKYQADGSENVFYNAKGKECYFNIADSNSDKPFNVICDKLPTVSSTSNKLGCAVDANILYFMVPDVITDATSAKAWLAENKPTFILKLAKPVTYNLGKLEIPSLPETISNVWTDAELTTNMSMTYKRDINIAFDNLVQAVVAAVAGE